MDKILKSTEEPFQWEEENAQFLTQMYGVSVSVLTTPYD